MPPVFELVAYDSPPDCRIEFFKSCVPKAEKAECKRTQLFLAGALGLEPRAYGFGDDADKSASGGLPFEVNISTIQKQIAAAISKTNQILNISGIQEISLRFSESTV